MKNKTDRKSRMAILYYALLVLSFLKIAPSAAAAEAAHQTSPICVTGGDPGNNQLLYFTSSSLTDDDRHMVFISDRTGMPNLFTRDLTTGKERQLTTNTEGVLKAYVYFDGSPYRGFGKGSVSLDSRNGTAYFIQGREIRAVTLDGQQRTLAQLPADQVTAFTHVSADGTRLCVPTTDARALEGYKNQGGRPAYDIDARVRHEHLVSYIRVYDTASGKLIACEPVTNAWITHVQFSPRDKNLILYNHEWSFESGVNRMWLWDGHKHLRLRTEGAGRNRSDWTCHEMWERDGSAIIYHGSYTNGQTYIGWVQPDGSGTVEIALPKSWNRYGHFTVGRPGELVTDGCYLAPGDPKRHGGNWISVLRVDWAAGKYDWRPLCRHGSSWTSQDAHPHPIFNHAASAIYFTSDMSGHREVYKVLE
jgi:hypothetical protein